MINDRPLDYPDGWLKNEGGCVATAANIKVSQPDTSTIFYFYVRVAPQIAYKKPVKKTRGVRSVPVSMYCMAPRVEMIAGIGTTAPPPAVGTSPLSFKRLPARNLG
jgi:hypothetical protein